MRVYAIGDVHGRFDLLYGLLGRIQMENRVRPKADLHIVMLGDLIDRGPQSAQVVEYLRGQAQAGDATFHFICGNHEEAMLVALDPMGDPELTGWLDFGGRDTMRSYGFSERHYEERGSDLARKLRAHIPDTHIDFIGGFVDRVAIGDYLFVHAGIRPGVPIDDQGSRELRWIREPFLSDQRSHGAVVVHGHTITSGPDVRTNRIGVDTGAYRTGILTAIGLENDDRWFLSVSAPV
jgi:serine/threonine protein phosphatase 1